MEAINSDNTSNSNRSDWKIDKRIPVWGIAISIGQGAIIFCGIYFTLYNSQMNLDKRLSLLEQTSITSEKFGRLDEKMNSMQLGMEIMRHEISNATEEFRKFSVRGKQ